MTRWIKVVAWATVYALVAWAMLGMVMITAAVIGAAVGPGGLTLVIIFAMTVVCFIPVADR